MFVGENAFLRMAGLTHFAPGSPAAQLFHLAARERIIRVFGDKERNHFRAVIVIPVQGQFILPMGVVSEHFAALQQEGLLSVLEHLEKALRSIRVAQVLQVHKTAAFQGEPRHLVTVQHNGGRLLRGTRHQVSGEGVRIQPHLPVEFAVIEQIPLGEVARVPVHGAIVAVRIYRRRTAPVQGGQFSRLLLEILGLHQRSGTQESRCTDAFK